MLVGEAVGVDLTLVDRQGVGLSVTPVAAPDEHGKTASRGAFSLASTFVAFPTH